MSTYFDNKYNDNKQDDEYANLFMKLTLKDSTTTIKSLSIRGLSYDKFLKAINMLCATSKHDLNLFINIYPDGHFKHSISMNTVTKFNNQDTRNDLDQSLVWKTYYENLTMFCDDFNTHTNIPKDKVLVIQ